MPVKALLQQIAAEFLPVAEFFEEPVFWASLFAVVVFFAVVFLLFYWHYLLRQKVLKLSLVLGTALKPYVLDH